MEPYAPLSVVDQMVAHLRSAISSGQLSGSMPGIRRLAEEGYVASLVDQTLVDLGMKVERVARMACRTKTDAWVIISATQEVLEWCEPSVSCICWNSDSWVRHIVRWVANVANGKDDRRQSFFKAEFVARGSIRPAPKGNRPSMSTGAE